MTTGSQKHAGLAEYLLARIDQASHFPAQSIGAYLRSRSEHPFQLEHILPQQYEDEPLQITNDLAELADGDLAAMMGREKDLTDRVEKLLFDHGCS